MKIESFDRSNLKAFNAAMDAAMAKVAADFGLTVGARKGRFSPELFTNKVEFKVAAACTPEASAVKIANEWAAHARLNGAHPDWLGMSFTDRGMNLKVVGCNPGRPKNFIKLLEVNTGKTYKASVAYVSRLVVERNARSIVEGVAKSHADRAAARGRD